MLSLINYFQKSFNMLTNVTYFAVDLKFTAARWFYLNLLRTVQRYVRRMNGLLGLSLLQTSTLLAVSSIPCYVKRLGDSLRAHSKRNCNFVWQNTSLKLTSCGPCWDQPNAARQFLEQKQTKLWVCLWDPDIFFTGAAVIHSSTAHRLHVPYKCGAISKDYKQSLLARWVAITKVLWETQNGAVIRDLKLKGSFY